MKTICYFLLLLPSLSKAQTFKPMDLLLLAKITETNSLPIIKYAVGTLGNGHPKFVSMEDSLPSDRKHRYYSYTFSSGAAQTIVLTNIYSATDEQSYATITYNVFDENLFRRFEKQLKDYNFSIVASSMTKDGIPFQMWSSKSDDPAFHYLKIHPITIFKKNWGYAIHL